MSTTRPPFCATQASTASTAASSLMGILAQAAWAIRAKTSTATWTPALMTAKSTLPTSLPMIPTVP
jgi:hypothetical protein